MTTSGPGDTDGYYLGIDLGTTYSAAAVFEDGRGRMIELGVRGAAVPSAVYLTAEGEALTGDVALRRTIADPSRGHAEFKRRIGDHVPFVLGGAPYSADRLAGILLQSIYKTVVERQGSEPAGTCLTHPANWGHYKTDFLHQAARQAGLPSVTLTTEPEAAVLHYAALERVPAGSTIAVYDFGGGTFDAAIVRKSQDATEILGRPDGIERLGGIDFDTAIAEYVWRSANAGGDVDLDDPAVAVSLARLRADSAVAKETLSSDTRVSIPVTTNGMSTEITLGRTEFERMISGPLDETISALHRTVSSANLEATDLSTVLLAGGSSRIPLVAEVVGRDLGRPIAIDAHPKHAVALGAAQTAAQVAGALVVGPDFEPEPDEEDGSERAAQPVPLVPGHVDGDETGSPGPVPSVDHEDAPLMSDDAEPPSQRWRWIASVAVVIAAIVGIVLAVQSQRGPDESIETSPGDGVPVAAAPTAPTEAVQTSTEVPTARPTTASTTPPTPLPAIVLPAAEPLASNQALATMASSPFWHVVVVDMDTGDTLQVLAEIASDSDRAYLASLSPDRRTAMYTREGTRELWAVGTNGVGAQRLASGLAQDARGSWSPDGTKVVYASVATGVPSVVVLDLVTGEETRYADDQFEEGDPSFGPNGDWLVFWRNEDGTPRLFMVDIDAAQSSPEQLSVGGSGIQADPRYSPDGRLLAFSERESVEAGWRIIVVTSDFDVMFETSATDDDRGPSWAPDSSALGFESRRAELGVGLYRIDVDRGPGSASLVRDEPGFDGHVSWS